MEKPILKVENLSKIYHTAKAEVIAVSNFTYEFVKGNFITIVGPSGCGKSTILNILANLDSASNGKIKFEDNIKIGYMLQQDALFDWLTVMDNCLLGLKLQKNLNEQTKEYVVNLLNTYGLGDFINSYPNVLSGGMRQRVALIRTLATKPDLIFMDEPFSALDYQTRLSVSDDVYNIIKKENKTAIMVTHDIAEAISMANEVIILSKRPSTIKKIIKIELTDKSNPINNRKAKEFSEYYNTIWMEIEHNV